MTTCKGSKKLRGVPRAITRYGELRGHAPLSAASGSERRRRADHQSDRLHATVLFKVTLKRHEIVEHTHVVHEPRQLPVVLSPEEVARLLDAAPGLKYKAALSVAYGAGLHATIDAYVTKLSPFVWTKKKARQRRFNGCRITQL